MNATTPPKVGLATLAPNAKEVLFQLFTAGPKWDGYVVSKAGRDSLHDLGLIERGFGWQWLTRDGVETATSEGWYDYAEGRARRKANTTIG